MSQTLWVALPAVVPLGIGTLSFLLGPRAARALVVPGLIAVLAIIAVLVTRVASAGPQMHALGGWDVPLGIALAADGLTASMLVLGACVYAGVLPYALGYFAAGTRTGELFWPIAWLLWGSVNALFVSADLFNLYVTLELVGLAAVGLTALSGTPAALRAALRYLLLALLGSSAFLLAVALLYAATGALSLTRVAAQLEPGPLAITAAALATTGLLLKSALFPLHGWLAPAHGGAVAPVSALLSALVIKASIYLLLRLWLGPFAAVVNLPAAGQLLGVLGAAAIVWGSVLALRQTRLKMLVAYSTVAQIGYLFIAFALLSGAGAMSALHGMSTQMFAHGLAKASMFLAAGRLVLAAGDDELERIAAVAARLPLTLVSFAMAGVTLAGLPPSGGFIAKWLLLQGALAGGQWWWLLPVIGGSLLAAAYVLRVARLAFTPATTVPPLHARALVLDLAALALALAGIGLGFCYRHSATVLDAAALLAGAAA